MTGVQTCALPILQFFVRPGEELKWFEFWRQTRLKWHRNLGLGDDKYRLHDHEKLAHYANAATDIEFEMPFGFKRPPGPCCWRSREQWHECGRVQCECEQHGYECECELLVAPIQARTKTNATEGPDRATWQKITTDAEDAGRAAAHGDGIDSFRSEHCRPTDPKRQTR